MSPSILRSLWIADFTELLWLMVGFDVVHQLNLRVSPTGAVGKASFKAFA